MHTTSAHTSPSGVDLSSSHRPGCAGISVKREICLKQKKQEYFYWHTLGQRSRGCSGLSSSLTSFIAWIQAFPSCCCPSVLLPSPLPSPIPLNRHICLVIIHSPGGSQRALLKCKSEHTTPLLKFSKYFHCA